MPKTTECRGKYWPSMLRKATLLRIQRKELLEREAKVKQEIKQYMIDNDIDKLYSISGYCATLSKRPGRLEWDDEKLISALKVTEKGLDEYKKQGPDIFYLTVKLS